MKKNQRNGEEKEQSEKAVEGQGKVGRAEETKVKEEKGREDDEKNHIQKM